MEPCSARSAAKRDARKVTEDRLEVPTLAGLRGRLDPDNYCFFVASEFGRNNTVIPLQMATTWRRYSARRTSRSGPRSNAKATVHDYPVRP
jgi:hypothetical protein